MYDVWWEEYFRELVLFKKTHGHCNVPNGWKENRALANWVRKLREAHKAERVSQERIRRLEEVGFMWNVPKRARR